MLNKLRRRLAGVYELTGRGLSRISPNPSFWSVLGFCLGVLAAWLFYIGAPRGGGLMLLASGFMDVADGAVARVTGRASRFGVFLDANLDRLNEIAVYTGIAASGLVDPVVVVLALSMSMMVSYSRAKVESLLEDRPRGIELGERAERLIVLASFSLLDLTWVGVLIVLVLASLTFVERFMLYYRGLVEKP
jgi:archaetidylinositol phosphate synthase